MSNVDVITWKNLRHYMAHDMDLGGHVNALSVSLGGSVLTYNEAHSDSVRREPGLRDYSVNFQGHLEHLTTPSPNEQAELFFEDVSTKFPVTAPRGLGQEGDPVYFGQSVENSFEMGGNVGELVPFTLDVPVDGPLTYGKVLRNAIINSSGASNPDTGAVTGSEIDMPGGGSGKALNAAVHLIGFTGTTITFNIESDEAGFPSPITRISLGPFTQTGSGYGSFKTPLSDTKVRVDVVGTFTSATFLISAGIGAI